MAGYRLDLPPDFDRPSAEREVERFDRVCRRISFLKRCMFWAASASVVLGIALTLSSLTLRFAALQLIATAFFICLLTALRRAKRRFDDKRWYHRRQLMEDATRRQELAHGLRALDECDTPVSATEWTLKMTNDADWAFGGQQQLLPTDTVVRFSPRRGAMGLAILRGDRIVAQYVELYID